MQAFEDYILAHPSLMRPDIWRWPMVLGTACFVAMALVLVFRTNKSKELSWSTAEGKCFRLSWCACIVAISAIAYDRWHHPTSKIPFADTLFYAFMGLWFLLFCISMVIAVKKGLRIQQAKKIQIEPATGEL